MHRLSVCFIASALVLATFVPHTTAQAQISGPTTRQLGGHTFVPSGLIADPFIGTYLRTTTGAGKALNLQLPLYNLEGEPLDTLSGDLAFFLLGLEYQQRLTKWLALRVGASGAARLGTDYLSMLAEGVSAIYGGEIGATFRLVEGRKYLLSAGAEARSNKLYSVSPLDFARDIIENGLTDSATALLSKGTNWRLAGNLRGAYAFAPWIGAIGIFELGPATRVFADSTEGRNTTQVSLGASVSADLLPITRVPIGFAASFLHQSMNDKTTDIGGKQNTSGLGVFYTGRPDLSLGLEITHQRLRQRNVDSSMDITQARLLLRYDF